MTDIRVRGVDDEVVEALRRSAEANGRSLEAEVRYRLEQAGRSKRADFPTAIDWVRFGFDDVLELLPGFQYLVYARMQPFRITLTRSLTGGDPEWNTEIEEVTILERASVWTRATDVGTRLRGETPAIALRDCMRWLADYAGVDAISRIRDEAERFRSLPAAYRRLVEKLDTEIAGKREVRERTVVIWKTAEHDIYVNMVDDEQGAVMVYPRDGNWSITNGKAMFFRLNANAAAKITDELRRLSVL